NGQIYFARLDQKLTQKPMSTAMPGETGKRKHPVIAVNAGGETILTWTEGTGWKKGGSLAWQVFDREGKPATEKGEAAGVPMWGLTAAIAQPDGSFIILY